MSGFYATHPAVSYSPYDDDDEFDSSDEDAGNSEGVGVEMSTATPQDATTAGEEESDLHAGDDDDQIPRSRLEFHSQEHSYIQEVHPTVPDDLVNLIRGYTQVALEDEVSTAETKYAMFAAKRHKQLLQAAFFVVFGFVLTLASAVLFYIDIFPGSARWYWPALTCPAVINMCAVPSTAEIWNLHIRVRRYLLRLRFLCWLGLALELVAFQRPPSLVLFVPLLIEALCSIYKSMRECLFVPKPPIALVHINTEQHAVTFWTLTDIDLSAPEVEEFPPPQNFKLIGWYPLSQCQLTLYLAPDRMWHSYSVAKLEAHNPTTYGGNSAVKTHVSTHVLVPRELQNLMVAKHADFLERFTLKTAYGGFYSGDRRPVLLTDLHRDHVLARDGYLGAF